MWRGLKSHERGRSKIFCPGPAGSTSFVSEAPEKAMGSETCVESVDVSLHEEGLRLSCEYTLRGGTWDSSGVIYGIQDFNTSSCAVWSRLCGKDKGADSGALLPKPHVLVASGLGFDVRDLGFHLSPVPKRDVADEQGHTFQSCPHESSMKEEHFFQISTLPRTTLQLPNCISMVFGQQGASEFSC